MAAQLTRVVKRAERGRRGHGLIDLGGRADVAGQHRAGGLMLTQAGLQVAGVAGVQGDDGQVAGGQGQSHGLADAARGPGNERNRWRGW